MWIKLKELLRKIFLPEARVAQAPKYICQDCGEGFCLPEALASHIIYRHKGVKLPQEATDSLLEHWTAIFPRFYVIKKYARIDC